MIYTQPVMKYILVVTIFAIGGKGEECPLGTYGETCDKNCSTNCAPSPFDKAVFCHKLTGRCSEGCKRGWHGDQCNLGCSKNCLNYVCNVDTGTCIRCKANYSGDYCETYEGSGPKKSETQTAEQNASRPVSMMPVPVFIGVVVILVIIIIIILVVYICRRRHVCMIKGRRMGCDDVSGLDLKLLADGADTDLHVACKEGNLQRVRDILDQSLVDINKQGKRGMTPVMWAARRGHRELVDLLVKKGADLKIVDNDDNNILHWACYGKHVTMVKHVVSKNMVDIKSRGWDMRTPLMCAACQGNIDMFQLLVSKGGLAIEADIDGNNILRLACWGGNVDIVRYILLHDTVDIDGRGQSGRTPLEVAACKGHGKIFDLLVTKGADLTVVDNAGNNILHSACLGGHANIVSRVLKLGKVDINSRGQCRRTPLMMAARMEDKEIFDLLVKEADTTLEDDDGNTILHHASEGGNVDIMKDALGVTNVDINARNKHRETPTMLATEGGDVCNLLVQRCGLMQ
ncbi:serine/threonine-protein phosphatase 6 regulatory ankyrin repeat subunit B-like isoform X2 [Haliotis rubra]|uniref:serine/threonine-protein phosphatase 6 regulatory ankyrin repeat subunit B-like isoform X2 n=1 Tax=Haliotis rubra TaxID=36100 RepID=UPI001EE61E74|nr:serine/threonine-protein phosphatase 6 regulatory ankyrin repeat subunit B-like isoform X2 [Haliotis rubra]